MVYGGTIPKTTWVAGMRSAALASRRSPLAALLSRNADRAGSGAIRGLIAQIVRVGAFREGCVWAQMGTIGGAGTLSQVATDMPLTCA